MSKRTIEDIPFYIYPLYMLWAWTLALIFLLQLRLSQWLCRIEYVGVEHVSSTPNHIFCIWHENLPLFFIAHPRFRKANIWLTFPLWFMKPIHLIKKLIGVKELAYGASGQGGKIALERVLNRLEEGYSTFLTPDGPKGPLKIAKDGVLQMSLESKTPIIPISFQQKNEWRIPSWDRKRFPLPFSKMLVVYGEPQWVNENNYEEIRSRISRAMDDPRENLKGQLKGPAV